MGELGWLRSGEAQVFLIASLLSLFSALAWIRTKRRFGESFERGRGSMILQSSATQVSGNIHPMDVENNSQLAQWHDMWLYSLAIALPGEICTGKKWYTDISMKATVISRKHLVKSPSF